MSKHFDFFKLSLPQAQELAMKINWERVFGEYEVLDPYIGILASQTVEPNSRTFYKDLAGRLDIILDFPFLRKPKYRETCNSALYEVCRHSKYLKADDAVNLARKLIGCGADVNFASEKTGKSCLQEALQGNSKLVQLLLGAGAVIADKDIFSCESGETVRLLLQCGASWKKIDPSVLPWGLCRMEISALKALIEVMLRDGIPIDALSSEGKSMLHIAAGRRDTALLAYLIPFFRDIDLPDDQGRTALMNACVRVGEDAEAAVRLLLSKRASVHVSDAIGKTALMWAIESTDEKSIIDALLKCKPDIAARDSLGNTPLHYCAARLQFQYLSHVLVQMLLHAGADVNAKNSFGQTALMLLSQHAPKAVAVLVKGGAALDLKDHSGCDVYSYAASESKKWLSTISRKNGNAGLRASNANPTKVKIRRSPEILLQIAKATALRDEVVTELETWPPSQHAAEYPDDIWSRILLAAKLGSEGIRVEVEEVVAEEVDRMGSMLSGPFFVSKQYPLVKGWYPVVQIDLRLMSALSGIALGDGLLQLWEPSAFDIPVVRVIPRDALSAELMTPFNARKLREQSESAVGSYWDSDPAQGVVQVFKTFESSGFQTENMQDSLEEALRIYDIKRPSSALLKLIKRFHASLAEPKVYEDAIQLFGCFEFIQYAFTDIGKHLLFTIPYGASGSAEVFYEVGTRGEVTFSAECATR